MPIDPKIQAHLNCWKVTPSADNNFVAHVRARAQHTTEAIPRPWAAIAACAALSIALSSISGTMLAKHQNALNEQKMVTMYLAQVDPAHTSL